MELEGNGSCLAELCTSVTQKPLPALIKSAMGRRDSLLTNQRQHRSQSTPGSDSIAEKFEPKAQRTRGRAASKMAPLEHEVTNSEDSMSASEDMGRHSEHPDHPLRFSEMTKFAADIKNSFASAITDLRADFIALSDRLSHTERAEAKREADIHSLFTCHTLNPYQQAFRRFR